MKVWELIYDDDDYDDDASPYWLLMHDVKMDMEKKCQGLFVIAFHRENGDVIFLLNGFDIYQYEIGSNKCEKVWQFPFPNDKSPQIMLMKRMFPELLGVYPVVCPSLGPTRISELPPIKS